MGISDDRIAWGRLYVDEVEREALPSTRHRRMAGTTKRAQDAASAHARHSKIVGDVFIESQSSTSRFWTATAPQRRAGRGYAVQLPLMSSAGVPGVRDSGPTGE